MEESLPFSVLNERMRPQFKARECLRSGSEPEDRQTGSPLPMEAELQEPAEPTGELDGWSPLNEDEESSDLLSLLNQCLIPALSITDVDSASEGDSVEGDTRTKVAESTKSCGTDLEGEESEAPAMVGDGGGQVRGSYVDRSLPDLIRSGRPICRRRTLGPVSDTLKEVRREVELSRKRSIRLKAQVDKLQESKEGAGWSQHRGRVTDEVLSILRLLRPLTEPESGLGLAEASADEDRLDAALSQLQNAARKLAISHAQQTSGVVNGSKEDIAILEQALRDRDDAIEKKKGMEAELLRSKTEMMLLNNQLLEAVQKRLELSLELEAWKEDLQFILQQQLQSQQQQQADQAQKKGSSRLGLMRRTNRSPIQRPAHLAPPTAHLAPPTPSTNSHQTFSSKSTYNNPSPSPTPRRSSGATQVPETPPVPPPSRNWRDRLKLGKSSRQGEVRGQDGQPVLGKDMSGFQVVSLD